MCVLFKGIMLSIWNLKNIRRDNEKSRGEKTGNEDAEMAELWTMQTVACSFLFIPRAMKTNEGF